MAHVLGEAPPGLRERKKQRTRAMLIDAAMELCLRQGYEQTTVEQIAEVADVSSRTFSRYFATKDAVFLTLIEDYVEQVAVELAAVPVEIGPLDALRMAHVATLELVAIGPMGRLSAERIVLMLRIVNATDVLRQAAFDFRHDPSEELLARRMGVPVGHPRAQLVAAVFAATIVTACSGLIADTDAVRLGPAVMIDRLNAAFEQLAEFTANLQPAPLQRAFEAVNV